MAARGEGLEQRAVGGRVAVAPGGGQAEAENDEPHAALLRRFCCRDLRRGSRRPARRAACRCARRRTRARAAAPIARARSGVSAAEVLGDVGAVAGDEHLLVRREEQLDALPGVGDQAGAGAGRLEHPGRRREADVGHGVAGDVQDRERARVEGVVLARVDVADVPHVRRHRLVFPAVAADEETAVGQAAPPARGRTARRAARGPAGGCRGRRGRPRSAPPAAPGSGSSDRARCRSARSAGRRSPRRRRRPAVRRHR